MRARAKVRYLLVLGGVLALGGGSYGAYSALTQTEPGLPEPVQFAPSTAPIPAEPGSLAELAQRLAARLLSIGAVSVQDSDVYVTRTAVGGPEGSRVDWEAHLLLGALLDQLAANGQGQAYGKVGIWVSFVTPEGSNESRSPGGNVVRFQHFLEWSDAEIEAAVRKGAEQLGLTGTEVTFLRPLQTAFAVVTHTADPRATAQALNSSSPLELLLGVRGSGFEGFYIEIRDQNEQPVEIIWSAARAGTGGGWMRPDLAEEFARGAPPAG